jgi:hypothetical protein
MRFQDWSEINRNAAFSHAPPSIKDGIEIWIRKCELREIGIGIVDNKVERQRKQNANITVGKNARLNPNQM